MTRGPQNEYFPRKHGKLKHVGVCYTAGSLLYMSASSEFILEKFYSTPLNIW